VIERNGQIPELRSDLRKRKALEWVVDNVEIVDPDGQPIDRADLVPALAEIDPNAAEVTEVTETEAAAPEDTADVKTVKDAE
jgi:hypothetical protein